MYVTVYAIFATEAQFLLSDLKKQDMKRLLLPETCLISCITMFCICFKQSK